MALTAQQAAQTIRNILAADTEPFNVARADVLAAITAADTWATNNAAAFNNALPAAAKSGLTTAQKNLLLAYVCLRRAAQ